MPEQKISEELAKLPSIPGAASVICGEDGFLKVVIDLNVPEDKFVETRVGAYGTLMWAQELAERILMMKEMRYAKNKAEKSLVAPPPGVVDIRGMRPGG